MRTFLSIVVPNSWGFTAAIATITFIGSWNSFLWPLVIGQDQSSWTVQVSLSTYITAQSVDLSGMFTAALVSMVPLAGDVPLHAALDRGRRRTNGHQ